MFPGLQNGNGVGLETGSYLLAATNAQLCMTNYGTVHQADPSAKRGS